MTHIKLLPGPKIMAKNQARWTSTCKHSGHEFHCTINLISALQASQNLSTVNYSSPGPRHCIPILISKTFVVFIMSIFSFNYFRIHRPWLLGIFSMGFTWNAPWPPGEGPQVGGEGTPSQYLYRYVPTNGVVFLGPRSRTGYNT